jgi:HPt (histidine-containing phosphotransfer) domain-containing protein
MSEARPHHPNPELVPLRSEFADDAEMSELVEFFLDDLTDRTETLCRAWLSGDNEEVCRLAHHLRGAGGGYGFPSITDAAAELEQAFAKEEMDAAQLTEKIESLIWLCRRATSGS